MPNTCLTPSSANIREDLLTTFDLVWFCHLLFFLSQGAPLLCGGRWSSTRREPCAVRADDIGKTGEIETSEKSANGTKREWGSSWKYRQDSSLSKSVKGFSAKAQRAHRRDLTACRMLPTVGLSFDLFPSNSTTPLWVWCWRVGGIGQHGRIERLSCACACETRSDGLHSRRTCSPHRGSRLVCGAD